MKNKGERKGIRRKLSSKELKREGKPMKGMNKQGRNENRKEQ
jgi:hypothetical protein